MPSQSGLLLNVLVKFQNRPRSSGVSLPALRPTTVKSSTRRSSRSLGISRSRHLTEKRNAAAYSKTGAIASPLSPAGKLTMHGWCSPACSPWLSIAVGLMPIHASGEGACISGSRRDKIWTLDDELAFLEKAPHSPTLASDAGAVDGTEGGRPPQASPGRPMTALIFELRQSKTGAQRFNSCRRPTKGGARRYPEAGPGDAVVNTEVSLGPRMGFSRSWRKACKKAGIVGVTFNDLRGTAVTRLAIAGCTEAEIVAITGHT